MKELISHRVFNNNLTLLNNRESAEKNIFFSFCEAKEILCNNMNTEMDDHFFG